MIPQAALNAWSQQAPWPSPLDVEQDLVLSRLIVDIANHPVVGSEVAVRVGLVEARYASKSDTITMQFDAEPTGGIGRIRVKVEINIREVEPAFDHLHASYRVDAPWFTGTADVLTFEVEEPLGTKRRALHQRRKGRDLFDLWLGLTHLDADPDRIVAAYQHYLDASGVRIRPADFLATLDEKLQHAGFLRDLDGLVADRPPGYSPEVAAQLVRDVLVPRMP